MRPARCLLESEAIFITSERIKAPRPNDGRVTTGTTRHNVSKLVRHLRRLGVNKLTHLGGQAAGTPTTAPKIMDAVSGRVVRDNLGGPEVGQVVLPTTPGGSPATRKRQVNVPLARNNDLPYGFWRPPIVSRTADRVGRRLTTSDDVVMCFTRTWVVAFPRSVGWATISAHQVGVRLRHSDKTEPRAKWNPDLSGARAVIPEEESRREAFCQSA